MTLMQRLLFAILLAASGLASAAPPARALQKVTFCIYDPLGTRGDAFSIAQDHALVARQWGVEMLLRPYTDERVAAEDFKAGHCDGVAMTTIRARQFNAFVGSVDSIGAVPSVKHMRLLEETLANPKLAARMVNGDYEVVGVVPMGAAYVLVTDRRIDSVEKAAGKKVAVLDLDKAQAKIVQRLGAQPVASDLSNFAGKFNNHQVDVLVAPVVLYQPMELYKGVGTRGAIYRFPLGQISATLLIHQKRFPQGFGQKSREHVLTQMDKAFAVATRAEKEIPESQWLSLSAADEARYFKMMREARIQLMNEGIYDKAMMRLLKNIRCRVEPGRAECAMSDE
ncbi:MAG: hypothetical protein K0S46_1196 [Moraxellaceae bacterium]|jgi:hypothetical protein|nr:hypothetical protein [Moraxellaceae bacterium]